MKAADRNALIGIAAQLSRESWADGIPDTVAENMRRSASELRKIADSDRPALVPVCHDTRSNACTCATLYQPHARSCPQYRKTA